MGEQVPDPHRLGGGLGDRRGAEPAAVHTRVGERRDEPADRVFQLEAPSSYSIIAATDVIGFVIE